MPEVREGEVLAGKFRIERVLGQGAMGVVVAATHIQLDERVALKFLLPEALINTDAVARFAREARAAVKIKSEHVARVSDVGTLESGSPYMVMEYLHGQDLSERLFDRGALPIADAVDFVLQACEALAEAHALGIVHRDLKPANLFVTTRPDGTACIKVLDFGISKFTTAGSASELGMTKTATVMGSPLYMSPEQLSSTRSVDARTDIWAIGVILYELISGQVPFEAETMPQLCGMVLGEAPPSLREQRPGLPEGLEAVVLRCLAKDRTQRYASIAELAEALAPFGPPSATRSAERIARVLGASSTGQFAFAASRSHSVSAATDNAVSRKATRDTPPRARGRFTLALFAAVALAIGAVVVLARRPETTIEHAAEPGARPTLVAVPQNAVPVASAPPPLTTSTSAAISSASASAATAQHPLSQNKPATAKLAAASAAPSPVEAKPAPLPTPMPVAVPAGRSEDVMDDRR